MRTSNIFTNIKKSDHNENQRQSVRHINPMSSKNFFNINNSEGGIARKLAPGITTTVFPGDQAMISVVRLEPEGAAYCIVIRKNNGATASQALASVSRGMMQSRCRPVIFGAHRVICRTQSRPGTRGWW